VYRVQMWVRKKEGMSDEEFRDHWLHKHAPIARDGYENLRGYVVNLVTGAPKGQDPLYQGVAELTWDSRDDFVGDMKSEAAAEGGRDLESFTDGYGMLFVDQHLVK
jgi:uncharacterized protein (TIGR02118 family)